MTWYQESDLDEEYSPEYVSYVGTREQVIDVGFTDAQKRYTGLQ